MKAKFFWPMRVKEPGSDEYVEQPAGYVLDHPDAWMQVMSGNAEPADDECRQRCNLTAEQAADLKRRGLRAHKRIDPEDFDIFEAGLMDGYDDQFRPTLKGRRVKQSVIDNWRDAQVAKDETDGVVPEGFEEFDGSKAESGQPKADERPADG